LRKSIEAIAPCVIHQVGKSRQGHAQHSIFERFVWKTRELYFQVDWQIATTLAIIALLGVGMFFVVVAVGEYRLSR